MVSSINYLWVSGNETMFQDCFKLPPAHFMMIDKDLNVKMISYWSLKDKESTKSEDELIAGLTSVFEKKYGTSYGFRCTC